MSLNEIQPGVVLNLCVHDVENSTEFFRKVGFDFDRRFTNAFASCMRINEKTQAMLLSEEHFKLFTPKEIADPRKTSEVLIAIQLSSKEEVISLCEKAFAAGGRKYKEADEHGTLFAWGFEDLDGHIWEAFWMNQQTIDDASIGTE